MGGWQDMRRDAPPLHEDPIHEDDKQPHRHFTQMRERRLSESSAEADELEEDGDVTLTQSSPKRAAHHVRGPSSTISSDDDGERIVTTRRRSGTATSTAGLRVGFSSLLNPTKEGSAVDENEG